jgi:tetraacyldisaccharide 4'-kinase
MLRYRSFWKDKNIVAFLLLPFSCFYLLLRSGLQAFKKPKKVDAFVICVGGAVIGGSGKTPIAGIIAKMLESYKSCIVSRGYHGRLGHKPIKVDAKRHNHADVGDEPLMLSKDGVEVYIGSDKYAAAQLAIEQGRKILILDDGMQSINLVKNLTFLVVDAKYGIGNGYVLPAGPLRAPFSEALQKADAVIITSMFIEEAKNFSEVTPGLKGKKIFHAMLDIINRHELSRSRFVGLCAIGEPEKFWRSIENIEACLLKRFDFPDHHVFSEKELEEIYGKARSLEVKVLTTAKDFERIPPKYWSETKVMRISYTIPGLEEFLTSTFTNSESI